MSFGDDLFAYRQTLIAQRAACLAEIDRMTQDAAMRQEPFNEADGARFDSLLELTKTLEAQCHNLWLQESAYWDREAARARAYAEYDRNPKPRPKRDPKPVEAPPPFVCNCATCRGEPHVDESPELPLPVMPLRAGGEVHYFPDDIDRRARAMEQWSPWGRRQRQKSRRYEGYRELNRNK